ncbi:MAG: TolC family protein [Alphaproteobacteria bacterium]|nr:TolC family protein [Alphaproteobacteria bacterium]
MFGDQEPISGPISMFDAMARAIKYNLDYRTKLMDEAIQLGVSGLSRYDLLPQITASAGYNVRDNNNASTSLNTVTGTESTEPSMSTENTRRTASLGFAWNVLDFGVSYIRAQQNSDRVLVAGERRRKAVQQLIQDVRSVYWRAATGARLAQDIERLSTQVRQAIDNARQLEEQRIQPPAQALEYQKTLLDMAPRRFKWI